MKLKIRNKEGELLTGILKGTSKKLIILCHGSRGSKNSKLLKYLSDNLKQKYSVFRFDFSGNNESEGLIENSTYFKDVEDIKSVVDYFIERGYQILSIIGHSKGGTDVFLYANKYKKNIKSFIAFAPRFNLFQSQEYKKLKLNEKEFKENGFYIYKSKSLNQKITKKYIDEIRDIKDVAASFSSEIPILIFHGNADVVIPIKDSKNFVAKYPEIRLEIIQEEDHCFENNLKNSNLISILKNWLLKIR